MGEGGGVGWGLMAAVGLGGCDSPPAHSANGLSEGWRPVRCVPLACQPGPVSVATGPPPELTPDRLQCYHPAIFSRSADAEQSPASSVKFGCRRDAASFLRAYGWDAGGCGSWLDVCSGRGCGVGGLGVADSMRRYSSPLYCRS